MPQPSPFSRGQVNSDIREWTRLIESKGAINLAQGVCHVEPFPEKIAAIGAAREALEAGIHKSGWNTYSHFTGITELREQVARKAREFNHIREATADSVMITDGASGAFTCAMVSLVQPGGHEEVVVFEPYYTYHTFLLKLLGITPKPVPLRPPHWSFTRHDLEAAASSNTRAILVNTPANPSGKVFSREELETIRSFCIERDLWAITDEVYEFMVYDGLEHASLASLPGMWERTVTMQSFSKPLSITGWRVGSALAPPEVLRCLGFANEYAYVCAPTPLQHGVIAGFKDWRSFLPQRDIYQRKRDILCTALESAGLRIYRPSGSIYVLADVSRFGLEDDVAVNMMLIDRVGVGGVPAHGFYSDDSGKQQIRFCFAVEDEILHEAAQRLKGI
jgi:aminotransferase